MMRPVGAVWADATEGVFLEAEDLEAWEAKWCLTCERGTDMQCPLIGVFSAGYTPTETTPIECSTYIPKEPDDPKHELPALQNGQYVDVSPSSVGREPRMHVGRDDETLPPVDVRESDGTVHR